MHYINYTKPSSRQSRARTSEVVVLVLPIKLTFTTQLHQTTGEIASEPLSHLLAVSHRGGHAPTLDPQYRSSKSAGAGAGRSPLGGGPPTAAAWPPQEHFAKMPPPAGNAHSLLALLVPRERFTCQPTRTSGRRISTSSFRPHTLAYPQLKASYTSIPVA